MEVSRPPTCRVPLALATIPFPLLPIKGLLALSKLASFPDVPRIILALEYEEAPVSFHSDPRPLMPDHFPTVLASVRIWT